MYHYGFGWIYMLLMMILAPAFLVAIVLAVVWLAGRSRPSVGETPLDILKRRYASGEITKEEFERMKQELS